MGASYTIFGRAFPTYQLALGTYALVATPIVISKLGKKPAVATDGIQASSKDEEEFIREFVRAAEEGEPKNV